MQHNFNELANSRCRSDSRDLQHDIRHKLIQQPAT